MQIIKNNNDPVACFFKIKDLVVMIIVGCIYLNIIDGPLIASGLL